MTAEKSTVKDIGRRGTLPAGKEGDVKIFPKDET